MNIYFWRTLEGQNSTFSGQGSKVIIVVVHVGAVKKYICSSTTGGAQEGKKERQDET
jgi:hypothetical protein